MALRLHFFSKKIVGIKITYDISSVVNFGYIWKNGSCVNKYLQPAYLFTDTLYCTTYRPHLSKHKIKYRITPYGCIWEKKSYKQRVSEILFSILTIQTFYFDMLNLATKDLFNIKFKITPFKYFLEEKSCNQKVSEIKFSMPFRE